MNHHSNHKHLFCCLKPNTHTQDITFNFSKLVAHCFCIFFDRNKYCCYCCCLLSSSFIIIYIIHLHWKHRFYPILSFVLFIYLIAFVVLSLFLCVSFVNDEYVRSMTFGSLQSEKKRHKNLSVVFVLFNLIDCFLIWIVW